MSKYIIIYIYIYIHNIYIYSHDTWIYHDFSMVITIRSQVINGFFANTGGSGQVGVDRTRRLGLHRIPTGDRCGRDEGWRSRGHGGYPKSPWGHRFLRSTWRIWGSPRPWAPPFFCNQLNPRHRDIENIYHINIGYDITWYDLIPFIWFMWLMTIELGAYHI